MADDFLKSQMPWGTGTIQSQCMKVKTGIGGQVELGNTNSLPGASMRTSQRPWMRGGSRMEKERCLRVHQGKIVSLPLELHSLASLGMSTPLKGQPQLLGPVILVVLSNREFGG